MGPNQGTARWGGGANLVLYPAPQGEYKTGGAPMTRGYSLPRHERRRTGISARQQKRRRTKALRDAGSWAFLRKLS